MSAALGPLAERYRKPSVPSHHLAAARLSAERSGRPFFPDHAQRQHGDHYCERPRPKMLRPAPRKAPAANCKNFRQAGQARRRRTNPTAPMPIRAVASSASDPGSGTAVDASRLMCAAPLVVIVITSVNANGLTLVPFS